MNESNNSKHESDVFFQAFQNNLMEFVNNIQNTAENEIRNSAENSSSCKVGKVHNESENVAMFRGNRLEGKFFSKNVINLSRRNLSSAGVSRLSKGLKFVPAANKIDEVKLKRELEKYGGKLRLMWHFRNDEWSFSQERFKFKSTFNPRNKDAVIETYLIWLKERLLDIEISSKRFNNLTKDERNAMYSLKDDKSIIMTGADKGAAGTVWDREDYIKEASKQLEDKEIYIEVSNDSRALVSTIFMSLEKIRKRGNLSQDTLNYILVKDPKFARFYFLPKTINAYSFTAAPPPTKKKEEKNKKRKKERKKKASKVWKKPKFNSLSKKCLIFDIFLIYIFDISTGTQRQTDR